MKIEKIRKSHKKEIILGVLAICIVGGALTFNLTRAKYKLTQDIPLVRGTVNYKVPDLRVVAIYIENDSGNYIETEDVPTSGYTLNSEKSICRVYDGTTTPEEAPKDENATIEYKDGAITFANITKKNTRCYLYFDKYVPTASETILANIKVNETTPDFTQVAETNEGVYSVSDPVYGGTSYYWRGAVTNNYVKFADKCWRIVRINGDGSIRLIYDGTICHANGANADSIAVASTAYNTSVNQSNYVGWTYTGTSQRPTLSTDANGLTTGGTASNAKTQLESWYTSNITGTNAQKVANGKYCNDRNAQSGNTWAISPSSAFFYAGYKRIWADHSPSLACSTNDVYTLKVGLITADEAMYAGGTNINNSSYYLYNGKEYWTMSPFQWYSSYSSYAREFMVSLSGKLSRNDVNTAIGLRPVINLKVDTLFATGGTGTQNNPYEVND